MQTFKEIGFKVRTTDKKLTLPVPEEWNGLELKVTVKIIEQDSGDNTGQKDDLSDDKSQPSS